MTRVRVSCLAALVLLACLPAAAPAFDPAYEQRNYAKINERAASDYGPEFQAQLRTRGLEREAEGLQILATDRQSPANPYGRDFTGNLCWQHMDGCAGDVRLYDWGAAGYGSVVPILFTARNGSTLSGHVWKTVAGPAKRPGVVITNGSVQAPEELYWFAAQTLAKAGYVVMTWDPQGQGYSDTYGQGVDRNDGVPSQSGRPFFDGTEDALDFFFSTPGAAYVPRPSCSSGTSHADKQVARVADGRSSAYNPFWASVDFERVGIVGHSLGAAAVSYVGQIDPRVDAIVAYDNLSAPGNSNFGATLTCDSGSSPRPAKPAVTKPAIGMAADYGLTPQPYTRDPDPLSKSQGSLALSEAGVDTGELVVRGGTHYEFSYIPNPAFGATRRGMDLASWYTTAWMDKYLMRDPTADARLLSSRWRDDRLEREVDGQVPPDGNLFSTYFRSRIALTRDDGSRYVCEDVRAGCEGLVADDGFPPDYSFLAAANRPDSEPTPGATTRPGGADGTPPAATGPGAGNSGPAAPGGGCSDRRRPRSRIDDVRRLARGIRVSGRAGDASCRGAGRVIAVGVSVALVRRGGCRYLRADGRFGPRSSCRRPAYLVAAGTKRWRLRVGARLPRARYRVRSRAVDASGNVERRRRSGNFRRLRIKSR